MDYLEWKNEKEIVTLNASTNEIVRCNVTDDPHSSFEFRESFEDFISDKNLSSMSIKRNFSEEIYSIIYTAVKQQLQ